jgi:hypothetical protein
LRRRGALLISDDYDIGPGVAGCPPQSYDGILAVVGKAPEGWRTPGRFANSQVAEGAGQICDKSLFYSFFVLKYT